LAKIKWPAHPLNCMFRGLVVQVATAVACLASDAASQHPVVDGGWTAVERAPTGLTRFAE
jgi:hypothetical protein